MDAITAIKTRRSTREFANKPIPKQILEDLVDAGRLAPTARNVQPWEFIVVTQPETLKKIGQIAETGRFISDAGACIAVFCSETKYYLEDGCAATENMLIAAAAHAIASCWVAGDKKPYCSKINELLGAPSSLKLISLIALGYPASKEGAANLGKRSLKELIHWDKF